jgi:transcriptional regulator with XRE-family HTH domain
VTPNQCRAARELLRWTEQDLASRAGVRTGTAMYFELGRGRSNRSTVGALRAALEAAGVEFIAENGGGPGVRLRKTAE